MSSYSISGKALQELKLLTRENSSGTFVKERVPHLWEYIEKYCRSNKFQTYFPFQSAGERYDVDIIGNSVAIYKH